ncbi:APC family permease [Gemmata sp. JC717]|uniref:APC family permease n=1 Tax=Gemmata algarum TaxID=2975278 RepID=UPI0021BA4CC7|nr:APC family permease [Gemmata algarum]MDY3551531.1 APC family permease [Gemmata algarum]
MALFDWLLGRPLATAEEEGERVGPVTGVPVLGLDGLASAAYGPEAALTVLLAIGAGATGLIGPITLLIVGLLFLVFLSYRQTIAAYPGGGGSYTVAKENLGVRAGLLAAAALMIDYVLVVAVGISAGIGALVSALPALQPHTLALCLVVLAALAIINLRGVRESGAALAVPTYLFVGALFGVLAVGVWKVIAAGGRPVPVVPLPAPGATTEAVGVWLLAKAFASGCTAMTGVEAVSNGVPAFREPRTVNARRTLAAVIVILSALLLGIAYLCRAYGVVATEPGRPGYDSVISQLVAAVAGRGAVYYVTIGSVLAVLCLSANTGFADFPRLCRAVAHDGYLPHGFGHRGRRLVYTRGIVVLTALSAGLLVAFDGVTDHLIPLFAVGAFLAFTLSQLGMVAHWVKAGGRGARGAVVVNAAGALGTAVALAVVLVAKFADGAWVTVLLVAVLMSAFLGVRRHYRAVAGQLSTADPLDTSDLSPPLVVILVRGWSKLTRKATRLAMRLSPEVYALHIAADDLQLQALEEEWAKRVAEPCRSAGATAPKLIVVTSPYRRLYTPLMEFLADLERAHPGRAIAVVVPELVEHRWYHYLLHNQTAAIIKGYLYFSGLERVSVVNVPWYLRE